MARGGVRRRTGDAAGSGPSPAGNPGEENGAEKRSSGPKNLPNPPAPPPETEARGRDVSALSPEDLRARYDQVIAGLSAFRRIGEILSETFELDEVCDRAVRIFIEELGFENASILLLAEDGKTLKLRAASGKRDASLSNDDRRKLNRALSMKVGEGVAGQVVATGRMILVPDVSKSPLFSSRDTAVTVRSLLCLPIVSKNRPIGALNLSHPRIEEISANLREVLHVLSSMVGQLVTISRLSSDLFRAKMVRSERLAGVGQLAASVVHEINNPLTNIMLRAQKIELDGGAPESVIKTATEIGEAGKKISRIVNRLLDYTRSRDASREPIDLHAVLDESLAMTQSFVSGCGAIRVEKRYADPEKFPSVVADAGCLEQVFTNLVINAALALKERGRGTIAISTSVVADGVLVEISDDGVGIPEENLDKIFQPFFTTRSESEGTGLGLFVCRDIVHEHGGQIEARSKPGEGSSFRITLPLQGESAVLS